ncbi:DeoR/GlpR family DNA-binding transcription regulator [Anaerocolumna sp. AGMB13025]|uniref:DeoR/GlpR family DNA-binding transcription regulator n=1 Tax=Anaerocolumna sp. AGMB13025 TaxID=3039116 RepID=UPI00241FEE1E|nr:DeoR/GlpR family DNA-binding transcription regulator [Anaerocolumna sp. AGMB13025]WFR58671.1 DeoR/GlpR family DNA-binding transcription regulator [Anaerocolumna sp. AGMB13025]
MSTKVDKRRLEILKLIQSEDEVSVIDMAKRFGVTMETIRGDFDFLAKEQGLIRTHGGLSKQDNKKYNKHYFFHERQVIHMEEKKKLCYRAMDFISDGDCIYIDSGSTVIYLLNYLNQKRGLTIVTNSIGFLICYILDGHETSFKEQGHRFIFIGGEVEANIMMTYGTFLEQTVPELTYDHLIFSVDALDSVQGGSNVDYQAYATIKSVLKNTRNKILLADSSKFDLRATYKVIGLEDIDCFITNLPLKENWMNLFKQKHIPYYTV